MSKTIPCNHCNNPRCRLCWLFANRADYRAMWGGDGNATAVADGKANRSVAVVDAAKPRISIAELAAKRKRCSERKAAGLPCNEFAPKPAEPVPVQEVADVARKPTWAYGLTTVPQRRGKLLPETLASLARSGFDKPVLFVDGCTHQDAVSYEAEFALPVVSRYPNIRTFGNWALGLAELLIRNPLADRFAMFQDDFVCSRNLRAYLEACPFPERGYWNLYTFDWNFRRAPRDRTVNHNRINGWFVTDQRGLGAVALVFDREGVVRLLSEEGHIVTRPMHAGERSWRNIDGGIVEAMKKRGYKEYCHAPSLVQHKGMVSVMRSKRHAQASSFLGEEFDLMELLKVK